jgi:hypothetical protein
MRQGFIIPRAAPICAPSGLSFICTAAYIRSRFCYTAKAALASTIHNSFSDGGCDDFLLNHIERYSRVFFEVKLSFTCAARSPAAYALRPVCGANDLLSIAPNLLVFRRRLVSAGTRTAGAADKRKITQEKQQNAPRAFTDFVFRAAEHLLKR